jgi:hypothetical protein
VPNDSRFRRKVLAVVIPFAAMLLVAAGIFHYQGVRSRLELDARQALEREWAAMKGYLRLQPDPTTRLVQDFWYYDVDDSDQVAMVAQIRDRCLIMDQTGRVLHQPRDFQEIGNPLSAQNRTGSFTSPNSATFRIIKRHGVGYLARAGFVFDEGRTLRYPAVLATPLDRNTAMFLSFDLSLSGIIVSSLLLGWAIARISPRGTP